jgi:hypothetical protein
MSIDFVQTALKNLKPDNPDWYSWASTDSDGNVIPCSERMCWEHTVSIIDGVVKPTKEEFDAEVTRLQAEYDAQAYARSRKTEYPTTQECVHAILDDDLDALQVLRQAVKNKYPKP